MKFKKIIPQWKIRLGGTAILLISYQRCKKKMPVRPYESNSLSLFVQKICWSFRRSWSWPTQCRKMVQKVCPRLFQTNSRKENATCQRWWKKTQTSRNGRKLQVSLLFLFIYYYWFIYFSRWVLVSANTKGLWLFQSFKDSHQNLPVQSSTFSKKIEAQRGAVLFSCFRNSRLYF